MKTSILAVVVSFLPAAATISAQSYMDQFSFQGFLEDNGSPVDDTCDLSFDLFAQLAGGSAIATTVSRPGTTVSKGLFDVDLDFSPALFDGSDRYLQITANCGGGNEVLSPRQPVTSSPYAMTARQLEFLRVDDDGDYANLIGGAANNSVQADVMGATISGGASNSIMSTSSYSTVGGGTNNSASQTYVSISGGSANDVSGSYGSVAGGYNNDMTGSYAGILSGYNNTANGDYSVIGGGDTNTADGSRATIAGGRLNTAAGSRAALGGGYNNGASADYSTIAGGYTNTAAGSYGTVPGGRDAHAGATGSFVFNGNGSGGALTATATNEFLVRATGGYTFLTTSGTTTGAELPAGSGSWSSLSDRNAKENLERVDPEKILDALATLPISEWNYTTTSDETRHIGVMAQDFFAAYGLGGDDRMISTVDADGIAMAAIQGLYARNKRQAKTIDELSTRLAELETQLARVSGD